MLSTSVVVSPKYRLGHPKTYLYILSKIHLQDQSIYKKNEKYFTALYTGHVTLEWSLVATNLMLTSFWRTCASFLEGCISCTLLCTCRLAQIVEYWMSRGVVDMLLVVITLLMYRGVVGKFPAIHHQRHPVPVTSEVFLLDVQTSTPQMALPTTPRLSVCLLFNAVALSIWKLHFLNLPSIFM